jgi:hypothetical protein
MKRWILILALFTASASAAGAECYADYKAKRDDPLRLHYGVIRLPDAACGSRAAAAQATARRIEGDGWKLLSIEGIFDRDAAEARRQSAGENYLRY